MFNLVRARSILLVSDSMAATGLADGSYSLGPQEVNVADGQARLATDGSLAGGTATLLQIVRETVAAGIPLVQAVYAATVNPASLIGLADEVGSLHYGFAADVLVLDAELQLVETFRKGQLL